MESGRVWKCFTWVCIQELEFGEWGRGWKSFNMNRYTGTGVWGKLAGVGSVFNMDLYTGMDAWGMGEEFMEIIATDEGLESLGKGLTYS